MALFDFLPARGFRSAKKRDSKQTPARKRRPPPALRLEELESRTLPSTFYTGVDAGSSPGVNVFDGATGTLKSGFFAYAPAFHGGVRVAIGDVNGDGTP